MYECIKDLQGGDFAVGRVGHLEYWQDMAYDWLLADGNEDPSQAYNKSIDDIADLWELEIVKVEK